MTLSDITNNITLLTGADTTAFPDADRLIAINKWYHKTATMILQSQDDWKWEDDNRTDFGLLTTSMVAAQRDYALAVTDDVLKIRRVDFTYDGDNYYRAELLDESQLDFGFGDDTDVDAEFSKTEPKYALRGRSVFVYPLANAGDVTAGAEIRMEVDRDIADFSSGDLTTGTKSPGFDEPFHQFLSLGPSFEFCLAYEQQNKADMFKQELLELEQRLKQHYGTRAEPPVRFSGAFVDYE